ncbi:MAG TPA: DUF2950 family protein, partial [Spongiibacteraceae bacterium]|nr:DUF2950 family protein [Spongiibacteraceae bacterium]
MSLWIIATVAATVCVVTAAARTAAYSAALTAGAGVQRRSNWRLICAIFGFALVAVAGPASAQHAYPTPEAAAAAMIDAVKREDSAALNNVLGANWRKFIPTQDPEDIDAFLAEWDKSNRIEMFAPGMAHIAVGDGKWELPIPIVHIANGWRFDVRAGADEMETRRIGRNELAAMQAALAYFDAQKDYARVDRMNDGVLQYAQSFWSSSGKHDGLYWPTTDAEEDSPLGPLFAETSIKVGE